MFSLSLPLEAHLLKKLSYIKVVGRFSLYQLKRVGKGGQLVISIFSIQPKSSPLPFSSKFQKATLCQLYFPRAPLPSGFWLASANGRHWHESAGWEEGRSQVFLPPSPPSLLLPLFWVAPWEGNIFPPYSSFCQTVLL